MDDSIFTKIIKREIPAEVVYEDDDVIAFLDIHPNNPGHTLVVPKKQCRNLFDVDQETFASVMEAARKLAPKLKEAVGADGMRLAINNEASGGQDVFHLHVHLIPFFDTSPALFPHRTTADPAELAQVAQKIRAVI